ncbi:Glycerate dehydrogenase HPR, peroxisomal [Capsicum chinense]|nr:Glycerate dehydrogenase HPR, peroxisomal [Capsicum chinense]
MTDRRQMRLAQMVKHLHHQPISLHPVFDKTTYHLVNKEWPAMMKKDEPYMKSGLADIKNVVVVPHINSAYKCTREGMATLASLNALVCNIELGCEKDESTPLVVECQNFRE